METKYNLLLVISLFLFSSHTIAQIKIIDFDNSKFKNGIIYDKAASWKCVASELVLKSIDGTPSVVLNYMPAAPFASIESNLIGGGCKFLSFDFKRLDLENCDVMVWVNDKVVTTIDQTNGFTQSVVKLPVFISGPIKFRFEQRGEKSGSIAIDNIIWTPCTQEEADVYAKEHKVVPPTGNLIFLGDFESGNLDNYTLAGNHKNSLVTTPVRAGKYALRSVVDRYDKDVNFRCEIVAKEQNTRQNYMYQEIGKEYWYGFSIFLPKDYVIDNQTEIIAQFHGTPDVGEGWFLPNLGLHIVENHYEINRYWDSKHISKWKEIDGSDSYSFGNIANDKGRWTDWVFNVNWSYKKDGDGFMKIWKDGVLIFDKKGPNCSNDDLGPFLRFGIYKWDWKHSEEEKPSNTTNRVIYHDEYRIGNANAKYEEVAPGGLSPTGQINLIDAKKQK